jgi:hypothetical protein
MQRGWQTNVRRLYSSRFAPVAQLDRVADFESEGWRFESSRAQWSIVNGVRSLRIPLNFQGFFRFGRFCVHRYSRRCVRVLQRILQSFRLARFQPLGRSARRSVASSVSPRPAGSFRSTRRQLAREIRQPIPFRASIGGRSLVYDGRGNLTEDENGFRYTYDHQNHLIPSYYEWNFASLTKRVGRLDNEDEYMI